MKQRAAWVDGAKAISIILLVLWHAGGKHIPFNEEFIFVRMPLFFFMSGLFASKTLSKRFSYVLRHRVANLLYLFVLWSLILFVTCEIPLAVISRNPVDWLAPLTMFIDPPLTLWFLYALALAYLIVRILRRVPWPLLFAASLVLYSASVWSGEWLAVPFVQRLVRLLPFFILGLKAFPVLDPLVRQRPWLWVIAFPLFLLCSTLTYGTYAAKLAPVTMALSILGILTASFVAQAALTTRAGNIIAWVGANTLFIYTIHRIPLAYIQSAYHVFGIDRQPVPLILAAVTVVAVSLLAGWLLTKWGFGFLFSSSWLFERKKAATPA